MLDIRTLLLGAPDDRYVPTPAMREAERLLCPLLCERRQAAVIPGAAGAARPEEVMR